MLLFPCLLLAACAISFSVPGKQAEQNLPSASRINPARVRSDDPHWQMTERELYAEQSVIQERMRKASKKATEFIFRQGSSTKKQITLTFDDGPHPDYTLKLLDILKTEHVPATFFVIGFMAEQYPELVKAIRDAGHEVGNHTYSHVTLTKIPLEQILVEYQANNEAIEKICGEKVRYCRPPGGDFNTPVVRASATLGLTTVLWTDDPGDYANPGDQVLYDREITKLSNGGIVLLHDGSQNTLDTLQRFIETAKHRGYQFVTLDQLRAQSLNPRFKGR